MTDVLESVKNSRARLRDRAGIEPACDPDVARRKARGVERGTFAPPEVRAAGKEADR